MRTWALPSWVLAGALLTVGLACKPEYPNCDSDDDCRKDPKEFCVERKCQQCRGDSDCAAGQSCKAGRCEAIPGWCSTQEQCKPGEACIANQCRPCTGDGECPSGSRCVAGSCVAKKPCKSDDDCAQNEDCVDGFCTTDQAPSAPPSGCSLEPVYFDFNESALTTEATSALAKNADCIKQNHRNVSLVGHTDSRGTEEYNLALSERRAQSVKAHLERLGVTSRMTPLPRGKLDATGTSEASWARDRRVDGEWK